MWEGSHSGLATPPMAGGPARGGGAPAWPPPVGGVPPEGGKSGILMYTVYILTSQKSGHHYIGTTSNIAERLRHHNSGANRSTRNKGPWSVVYSEEYNNKSDAWKREQQIKSYKGGNAFKKLIGRFA